MKESKFQKDLIAEIQSIFDDCIVVKNDSSYIQGIPDLTVFCGDKWAMLECKKDAHAPTQPNQPYYIHTLDAMSFARVVYPENKEEVINALRQKFES